MRRSKCLTAIVMVNSFASICLHCLATLCFIVIVSGCSNGGSDTAGTANENNAIIVVSPNNPTDDSPDPNIQNNSNATTSNTNNVNSDQTSSLQDNDDLEQLSQSTENNTTQPHADDTSINEHVSPNVLGGLPTDCIFDISAINVTFCYQTKTRMLRAWQSNGLQWWAYNLPGDNATNEIHALQVANGYLYIISELKANGIQTGFEISVFALSGEFVKTVALNKFQDYSFVAGHRIQVADIGNNLIIAGDYGLSSNNILPNQFNGTFIAIFNTTTEQVVKSNLYSQLRQTNPIQIRGNKINLELEHLVYEVSLSNLELMEPVTRFQSIPFNRTNHHQKKQSILGFIEKPPVEALHEKMNTAFLNALRENRQVDSPEPIDEPIDCVGGGTVQQINVVDAFDSEVRTTTFDNCSMALFNAHGVLLQRQTRTCGEHCEGLNKTLRALSFEIAYTSGERWSVDGYISIKETRNSFNQETGPIDEPETVYTNLTEFNVFSISDDQITIDLDQVRYQYDGTLKSGTGTWVGSGTVSYATGVTETFSVDLSRQLVNGTQREFSGQIDANRSDGTALYVGEDTANQSRVQYTITAAGESVQTSSSW